MCYAEVTLSALEMHALMSAPTHEECEQAGTRTAHTWIRQTARASLWLAVREVLTKNEFGVVQLGVYLDNMAKHIHWALDNLRQQGSV